MHVPMNFCTHLSLSLSTENRNSLHPRPWLHPCPSFPPLAASFARATPLPLLLCALLSPLCAALGLGVNTLLLGLLSNRFSEGGLVSAILLASAANAAIEASHATFGLYAALNLPVSAVAGALMRTTLQSLFSKAVPVDDVASALSVLDVLNSAVGITAPIYGGTVLGRIGVEMQPAVSVTHYLLLFCLARVTIASLGTAGGEEKQKSKAD